MSDGETYRCWDQRAACGRYDPDMWSLDGPRRLSAANRAAMAICRRCPVRVQCAEATDPLLHAGTIRAGRAVWRMEPAVCRRCARPFERTKGRGNAARYCSDTCRPSPPAPRGDRPPPPCGTYAAHQRHRARGERACEPCREAARRYVREYKRRLASPQEVRV